MERRFNIGDYVRNTRTEEKGVVTTFDFNPEVYVVRKDDGYYAMWGELEMEERDDVAQYKYGLTDKDGNWISCRIEKAMDYMTLVEKIKREFGSVPKGYIVVFGGKRLLTKLYRKKAL